jgi:hypothetical protein
MEPPSRDLSKKQGGSVSGSEAKPSRASLLRRTATVRAPMAATHQCRDSSP